MTPEEKTAAIQTELRKHTLSTFVEGGVSMALGGEGVVVTGCPECKKKLQTVNQFLEHLANDVVPMIMAKIEGGARP